MRNRRDDGQDGYMKDGMQDRTDAGKVGCRAGVMQDMVNA